MNIFAWFATLGLYFVLCTIVPLGSGGVGIVFTIWRRTRNLGLGILFAGGTVGFLFAILMAVNSSSYNAKISNLIFAGFGGWVGFGIGATTAIIIGTPIFLVVIFSATIFKSHKIGGSVE